MELGCVGLTELLHCLVSGPSQLERDVHAPVDVGQTSNMADQRLGGAYIPNGMWAVGKRCRWGAGLTSREQLNESLDRCATSVVRRCARPVSSPKRLLRRRYLSDAPRALCRPLRRPLPQGERARRRFCLREE